jgi:hypothetical protein
MNREFTNEELQPAIVNIFREIMYELYTWSKEKKYTKLYRITLHGDVMLCFYWKKIKTYSLYCHYAPCSHYTLNEDDEYILSDLTKNYLTPKRIDACIQFLKDESRGKKSSSS